VHTKQPFYGYDKNKQRDSVIKAGYKQTEVGVIPEDWEVNSIFQTMKLVNGYGFKPSQWSTEGLPIIRIQNLNDIDASFNYFNGEIEEKYHIRAGDLLFAWSGSKGTSFGARIWQGEHALLNQHIFKIIPDHKRLIKEYAYLVLRKTQEDIEKMAHGFKSSFVHVKKSDLVKVVLPIPLKKEQTAIAKVLSDTDALIQSLSQLIAKKCQIKQGAMQTLLNPYDETGTLKAGWVSKKLGEVAFITKLAGFEYSNYFNSYKDGGEIIVIRGTNITKNELNLSDIKTIPRSISKKLPRSKLSKGDLVFAYVGTIGPVYLVNDDDKFHLGPNTCKISAESVINNNFLHVLFTSHMMEKEILENTSIGAQPSLSMSKIRAFNFSFPEDIAEQTQIAQTLTDMDTEITALKTKLSKYQKVKQGMMQNLLTGRIRLVSA